MDITPLLAGLNDAQRAAVTSESRHLLVLAGAGSGKTRVLVQRIAWLIDVQGHSPQGVLAVTFTNKAAREMRARIEHLLSIPTRSMWVGTFHGIANRLLSQHWQEAGLPQHFQILDSDDQRRLIKRTLAALHLDEAQWPPRQMQWFINQQKDAGQRAADIEADPADHLLQTQLQVYAAYEAACRQTGAVDFAELLLRSYELWRENPKLLAAYQTRFHSILVDEFQDTNAIQYAWLKVLAGEAASVTAVGDDDQSIYGWRGARVDNILNFANHFPDTATVRLEQNYRSTANILKAANAVIAHNPARLGKKLWTESTGGEPLSLYTAADEQDEAHFIADTLQEWAERGHAHRDSAVLYRSNVQSRVLEEALLRRNLPYRIYGGQRFYERLEIRNAVAYLRLAVNRDDDAAFERVVNLPTRGIGARTLDQIRQRARAERLSLFAASRQLIDQHGLPARAANALFGFLRLIDELATSTAGLELAAAVEHTLETSGLLEFYANEKGERGQTRVDNLHEIISACKDFQPDDPAAAPLPQFLAAAALDAGDTQAGEDQDAVQLMTLHSAKGLEFPLVIIAGLEENLFPHARALETPDGLAEERRLAYVGITRAISKLVLATAQCRRIHGGEHYNQPSRFLRDLPPELVEAVHSTRLTPSPQPAFKPSPITAQRDSAIAFGAFGLGQRVQHPKFGEGVVLNLEGAGHHARAQVRFRTAGTKWLVLSHARLQAV